MDIDEHLAVDTAIRRALDGSAVLFVGAGVSFLSTGDAGNRVPNGLDLSRRLHADLDIAEKKHTLDRIAGYYVQKFGTIKLYDLLRSQLTVRNVDPRLATLYNLRWRRIYTTNYDDAIEIARKGQRAPRPFTLAEAPDKVPEGSIVHLNGFIQRVGPHDVAENLTLTDVSYATSNLDRVPWGHFFRTDLRISRSVIFVGYSLADLDIARVLLEDVSLRAKTVFVIGPDADDVDRGTLARYGTVCSGGVEELFARLSDVSNTYSPPRVIESYYSVQELGGGVEEGKVPAATRVHEQLVYGHAPVGEILRGAPAFGEVGYLVRRKPVTDVIGQVRVGGWRDVTIVGGLASGKTFAAIQLAAHFLAEGYRVFWVQDGRCLRQDLDRVAKLTDKTCVIVDGYRNYIDAIRFYVQQRPLTHALVLTERSVTHELLGNLIEAILDPSRTLEISLNILEPTEIQQFDQLINFAGLWGELAGLSPDHSSRDRVSSGQPIFGRA